LPMQLMGNREVGHPPAVGQELRKKQTNRERYHNENIFRKNSYANASRDHVSRCKDAG
jgi:hypothetical protein